VTSALARYAALTEEERAARFSLAERLAMLAPKERQAFLRSLPARLRGEFLRNWHFDGRPAQLPPGEAWRVWLIMAGRGFGKTRAGAEWIHDLAAAPALRIALVGPTDEEARAVMVEGSSGILACAARSETPPYWEPSRGRLTWPSGSQAFLYSGANPDGLRGPEHDLAWCDELAKWARAEAAWDNLALGLRRGGRPRVLATTTPRPTPLMRRLAAMPGVVMQRGRTADNPLLPASFLDHVTALYGGTRLGRQELDGELIEEAQGSLWPRALIERARDAGTGGRPWRRVVVGVDPPVSADGDACGILVCALGADERAYVLADATVERTRPEGWARAVAAAAEAWQADRVVAEGNQGGAMVETVLRGAAVNLPVKIVHASHGKSARAEPVAALFEGGRAKFAGAFPELEDELAGLTAGGGYEGPGRSPDRADAMVWAMTELMLGKRRAEPRITLL
jgi:phage terminase large subunit-like protein